MLNYLPPLTRLNWQGAGLPLATDPYIPREHRIIVGPIALPDGLLDATDAVAAVSVAIQTNMRRYNVGDKTLVDCRIVDSTVRDCHRSDGNHHVLSIAPVLRAFDSGRSSAVLADDPLDPTIDREWIAGQVAADGTSIRCTPTTIPADPYAIKRRLVDGVVILAGVVVGYQSLDGRRWVDGYLMPPSPGERSDIGACVIIHGWDDSAGRWNIMYPSASTFGVDGLGTMSYSHLMIPDWYHEIVDIGHIKILEAQNSG